MATPTTALFEETEEVINDPQETILQYPDWKNQYSATGVDTEIDLPHYLDYQRFELFKLNALTREKEQELQEYYVDWSTDGQPVSDEEYLNIASQSTGYAPNKEREQQQVGDAFGNTVARDYLNQSPEEQAELRNKAREKLLRTQELPFATIVKDGIGRVEIGNYEAQGMTPGKQLNASNDALTAFNDGDINPRDLWQVTEGLAPSGKPGFTNFQERLHTDISNDLQDLLAEETGRDGDSPVQDAIVSLIVPAKGEDPSLFFQPWRWFDKEQWEGKPDQIGRVVLNKIPREMDIVEDLLVKKFAKRAGMSEEEAQGLSYVRERVQAQLKELATQHANQQGVFKFYTEEKYDYANIRVTEMGNILTHPRLMQDPLRFNKAIEIDKRLTDQQKEIAKRQRNWFMLQQMPDLDKLFTQFDDDALAERWVEAKTANPKGWSSTPVEFYDSFVSDRTNYSHTKNFWGAPGPDAWVYAIGSLLATAPVLLGHEASALYLQEHMLEEQNRKRLAGIFGDELGLKYELANLIPQVVSDLAATAVLIGPLSKAGRGMSAAIQRGTQSPREGLKLMASRTLAKEVGEKASVTGARVAATKAIEKSLETGAGAYSALKAHNVLVGRKFGVLSSVFLTAANRSTGAMFATIYSSLPEDMSHEEKHDKALGHSLIAGAITGLVTAGFSAIGRGGVESVFTRGLSFKGAMNVVRRVSGASKAKFVSTDALKRVFSQHIAAQMTKVTLAKGTRFGRHIFSGAIHEGLEEGIDQWAQTFVEDSALHKHTPMMDRVMSTFHAFKLGAIMGGGVTVATPATGMLWKGTQRLAGRRDAIKEEESEFLGAQIESAAKALEAAGSPLSGKALRDAIREQTLPAEREAKIEEAKEATKETVDPSQDPQAGKPLDDDTRAADAKKVAAAYQAAALSKSGEMDPSELPVYEGLLLARAENDPNYLVTKDGSVIGVLDPATNEWVGQAPPSQEEEAAEAETAEEELEWERRAKHIDMTPEAWLTPEGIGDAISNWLGANRGSVAKRLKNFDIELEVSLEEFEDAKNAAEVEVDTDGVITLRFRALEILKLLEGTPASKKATQFDALMGHELAHVAEAVHLRNVWQDMTRPGTFYKFYNSERLKLYRGLAKDHKESLRKVAASYLGIRLDQVVLPGEEATSAQQGIDQLDSQQLFSEFVRYVMDYKRTGRVAEAFGGLTLTDEIRGFLNDVIKLIKELFLGKSSALKGPAREELAAHIKNVEAELYQYYKDNDVINYPPELVRAEAAEEAQREAAEAKATKEWETVSLDEDEEPTEYRSPVTTVDGVSTRRGIIRINGDNFLLFVDGEPVVKRGGSAGYGSLASAKQAYNRFIDKEPEEPTDGPEVQPNEKIIPKPGYRSDSEYLKAYNEYQRLTRLGKTKPLQSQLDTMYYQLAVGGGILTKEQAAAIKEYVERVAEWGATRARGEAVPKRIKNSLAKIGAQSGKVNLPVWARKAFLTDKQRTQGFPANPKKLTVADTFKRIITAAIKAEKVTGKNGFVVLDEGQPIVPSQRFLTKSSTKSNSLGTLSRATSETVQEMVNARKATFDALVEGIAIPVDTPVMRESGPLGARSTTYTAKYGGGDAGMRMQRLTAYKMYAADLGDILVKEMSQNSFDAIKEKQEDLALFADIYRRNPPTGRPAGNFTPGQNWLPIFDELSAIEEEYAQPEAIQAMINEGIAETPKEAKEAARNMAAKAREALTQKYAAYEIAAKRQELANDHTIGGPQYPDGYIPFVALSTYEEVENTQQPPDEQSVWFYMFDNGVGMNKDIILNALLVNGGSAKGTKNPSGGLGMAKMAWFGTSQRMIVDTVRDGIRTQFESHRPMHGKEFQVTETEVPYDTPSYTEIRLEYPKYYDYDPDADPDEIESAEETQLKGYSGGRPNHSIGTYDDAPPLIIAQDEIIIYKGVARRHDAELEEGLGKDGDEKELGSAWTDPVAFIRTLTQPGPVAIQRPDGVTPVGNASDWENPTSTEPLINKMHPHRYQTYNAIPHIGERGIAIVKDAYTPEGRLEITPGEGFSKLGEWAEMSLHTGTKVSMGMDIHPYGNTPIDGALEGLFHEGPNYSSLDIVPTFKMLEGATSEDYPFRTVSTEYADFDIYPMFLGYKDKTGKRITSTYVDLFTHPELKWHREYGEDDEGNPVISTDPRQFGTALVNGHYTVYSNGLYQFKSNKIYLEDGDYTSGPLPMHIIINVRPKVPGVDPDYPISNNREQWAPKVKEEGKEHPKAINDLIKAVRGEFQGRAMKEKWSVITGPKNPDGTDSKISPDKPVIYNNVELTPTAKEQEFLEEFAQVVFDVTDFYLGFFHQRIEQGDFTSLNNRTWATRRKNYWDNEAHELVVPSHSSIRSIKEARAEFGSEEDHRSDWPEHFPAPSDYYYGVGLSTSWFGVNRSVGGGKSSPDNPSLILINPLYGTNTSGISDPAALKKWAACLNETILHELNHIEVREEGGKFTWTYGEMWAYHWDQRDLITEQITKIQNVLEKHAPAFRRLQKKYDGAAIKVPDAELPKGSSSPRLHPSQSVSPGDADAGRQPDRPVRVPHGYLESRATPGGNITVLEAFAGRTFRLADTDIGGPHPRRLLSKPDLEITPIPVPIDTDVLSNLEGVISDASLEEQVELLEDRVHYIKAVSETYFDTEVEVDPESSIDQDAIHFVGGKALVNPYGLARLIDGRTEQDTAALISAHYIVKKHEADILQDIPEDAYTNLEEDIVGEDFQDLILKTYTDPARLALAQEQFASEDPAIRKAGFDKAIRDRVSLYVNRVLNNTISPDDEVFLESHPRLAQLTSDTLTKLYVQIKRSLRTKSMGPIEADGYPYMISGLAQLAAGSNTIRGFNRIPHESERALYLDPNNPEQSGQGILNALQRHSEKSTDTSSPLGTPSFQKRKEIAAFNQIKRDLAKAGERISIPGTTIFSGGGFLEVGMPYVNWLVAVEFDPEIAEAYEIAHGRTPTVKDVNEFDLTNIPKNGYFHASPSCVNYTKLKWNAVETKQDIKSARVIARVLNERAPVVFTLENTPRYKDSKAERIIMAALKANGYVWDSGVYNAADYGAPINRSRYLIRAIKEEHGPVPEAPLPSQETPSNWYDAIADLIDTLPPEPHKEGDHKHGLFKTGTTRGRGLRGAPYIYEAFKKRGWGNPERPRWRAANIGPMLVNGTVMGGNLSISQMDEPAFSFSASPGHPIRLLLPDGKGGTIVKRLTPRARARLMGIPDSFILPEGSKRREGKNLSGDHLAETIIGNAVPPALAHTILGPLFKQVDSSIKEKSSILGARKTQFGNTVQESLENYTQALNKYKTAHRLRDWAAGEPLASEGTQMVPLDTHINPDTNLLEVDPTSLAMSSQYILTWRETSEEQAEDARLLHELSVSEDAPAWGGGDWHITPLTKAGHFSIPTLSRGFTFLKGTRFEIIASSEDEAAYIASKMPPPPKVTGGLIARWGVKKIYSSRMDKISPLASVGPFEVKREASGIIQEEELLPYYDSYIDSLEIEGEEPSAPLGARATRFGNTLQESVDNFTKAARELPMISVRQGGLAEGDPRPVTLIEGQVPLFWDKTKWIVDDFVNTWDSVTKYEEAVIEEEKRIAREATGKPIKLSGKFLTQEERDEKRKEREEKEKEAEWEALDIEVLHRSDAIGEEIALTPSHILVNATNEEEARFIADHLPAHPTLPSEGWIIEPGVTLTDKIQENRKLWEKRASDVGWLQEPTRKYFDALIDEGPSAPLGARARDVVQFLNKGEELDLSSYDLTTQEGVEKAVNKWWDHNKGWLGKLPIGPTLDTTYRSSPSPMSMHTKTRTGGWLKDDLLDEDAEEILLVNTEAVAKLLKGEFLFEGRPVPANPDERVAVLHKGLTHEIVHSFETNVLYNEWKKVQRQPSLQDAILGTGPPSTFIQYQASRMDAFYKALTPEQVRSTASLYSGLEYDISDVRNATRSQRTKVVFEFVRQVIELRATGEVSDLFGGPVPESISNFADKVIQYIIDFFSGIMTGKPPASMGVDAKTAKVLVDHITSVEELIESTVTKPSAPLGARAARPAPSATLNARPIINEPVKSEDELEADEVELGEQAEEEMKNTLQLLELALWESGEYREPGAGKPKVLRKLVQLFAGTADPNLRRLKEQHEGFYAFINKYMSDYATISQALIQEVYLDKGIEPPFELIQKATGSTAGYTLTSDNIQAIENDYNETIKQIADQFKGNPLRQKFIKRARALRESRVNNEIARQTTKIKREARAALNRINKDSPELARHLKGLRKMVDTLSENIKTRLGTDPKLQARFTNQLEIYLTRSYKIFSDPGWKDLVLNSDAQEYVKLREAAKEQYIDLWLLKKRRDLFTKYSKKAPTPDWEERSSEAQWEYADERANKELELETSERASLGIDFADQLMRTQLDRFEMGNTDVLHRKDNIPAPIRKLLGEYGEETGDFNLMRTFLNVGNLAANQALAANIVEAGRSGEDMSQWWFFTEEERYTIEKENKDLYEKIRAWKFVSSTDKELTGSDRFNPLKDFKVDGISKGPLLTSPELHRELQSMFVRRSEHDPVRQIQEVLDTGVRKLVGYSLAAKTLGSGPFYVRNITSNLVFFSLAQGMAPTGLTKILSELNRAVRSPKEMNAYIHKLTGYKILDNDFTTKMLEDILTGKTTPESILKDTNKIIDNAMESQGYPVMDRATDFKTLKGKLEGMTDVLSDNVVFEKLRKLSIACDAFYKIAYFEKELKTLQEAQVEERKNGKATKLRDATPIELEREAQRKVLMTAQSFSQAMDFGKAFQISALGPMLAPYLRFKLEVPRIVVNTYKLGWQELRSGNSVLRRRGARRLVGMTGTATAFSVFYASIGQWAVSAVMAAFGHEEAEDITDEMRETLLAGVPPYLKTHTFYYTRDENGKLHSWDLTYLNPFAMYTDAAPQMISSFATGDYSGGLEKAFHTAIAIPFMEGQIPTSAYFSLQKNMDAKGNPIILNTDTGWEKLQKSLAFMYEQAYEAPTIARMGGFDFEKLRASIAAGRSHGFNTPMGMMFNEFIPVKGFPIDANNVAFQVMKSLRHDKAKMRNDINKLATSGLMHESEVKELAQKSVELERRLARRALRYWDPLLALGADQDSTLSAMNRQFTAEGVRSMVLENEIVVPGLSDNLRDIIATNPNRDVIGRGIGFQKEVNRLAPNGRVPLD